MEPQPTPDPAYRRGVGIMLINAQGQVFAAQRIDVKGEAWQMPQGGIDAGESPEQAALRELEEEIGTNKATIMGETRDWLTYDLPTPLQGGLWRGRYKGQTQKWYAMRFTGVDADICLETAHPEFRAWAWVPVASLVERIVPFKRALYEAVVAELGSYARPL
ncbi:RNA pyrophosphohydrolase [Pararhodospirillum photometricum]|uniref:RNA pyrophosphohydrolase n=1 Tax=Pararhodospirillum photometricum TaxID=1084 RepID=UPI003BB777F8